MDTTLGIAVVAVLLGLLFVAGVLVMLGLAVLWLVRSRRRTLPPDLFIDDENSTMVPSMQSAADLPVGSNPLVRDEPTNPSLPAPPPALANGGLIGFFDDEHSTTSIDAARTELFQRGKIDTVDWDDDDDDEYAATEIFSAHGGAGDLAEFAFDDNDDSTGRFN